MREFEDTVARYTGAPYALAVDCCTNGIFLSLLKMKEEYGSTPIYIPARTYISVPAAIVHAGYEVRFTDDAWKGMYQLQPFPIWDGARRFCKYMYNSRFTILSFHSKKHIPIGRGGMILCDSKDDWEWLFRMSYDGREGKPYSQEVIHRLGYHMYMTPEQAARGLLLFETIKHKQLPDIVEDDPDLRNMPCFQKDGLSV